MKQTSLCCHRAVRGHRQRQSGKPNILAIMTDDLDIWNISAYQPIRPFSPVD